jgi:predicted metal-dependent phosphotriesterase family hydrolase
LAAAREARRVTGAPISILVEDGDALDLGVDAGTIVNLPISRIDSAPVERWLANGASVAFLGWQRDSPEIVAAATRRIAELVAAGFGDRLLISTGSTRRDTWLSYGGGPGIVHLIDRVPLDLMEAGLTAPEVRAIFFENPAAALTIYPP